MKRLEVGLEMGQQSRVGKVLRATRMTGMASNWTISYYTVLHSLVTNYTGDFAFQPDDDFSVGIRARDMLYST